MDSVLMACGLMKLWVAPQSSSALVWVILCHMLTVKGIVIEFFCVLYMWATDAGVLVTVKLWQTKNPGPCLGHLNTQLFLLQPFFQCVNLLCFGKLWGRGGIHGFFPGCFSGLGLTVVDILWAAACHVAL